ncbi:MAG TPA: carboxypeptidase-like regulatory domain-containing protein [Vicinamibacterales bacterium]|nr:carboxypeptidase-like regulatory domain-containing protein [Vicinamibacterales bacterium]
MSRRPASRRFALVVAACVSGGVWASSVEAQPAQPSQTSQPSPPPARDNSLPARDNSVTTQTGSGVIRGRVVVARSERGLSRVVVRANSPALGPEGRAALTDGNGRYELTELPAASFTVVATRNNYVRAAWGERRLLGPGERITVGEGQAVSDINLMMSPAGVITGRVVDEFGDPITGVAVQAMRYAVQPGGSRLVPGGRGGITNDIGEFRVFGIAPGQYYVSASPQRRYVSPGGREQTVYSTTFYPGTGNVGEAQRIRIGPGQIVNDMSFTLLPVRAARVSGLVLDASGRPLGGGFVNAFLGMANSVGFSPAGASIGSDGTFHLESLAPGEYVLRGGNQTLGNGETAAAEVTVNGSDISGVQLTTTRPTKLRGRVVVFARPTTSGPKPSEVRVTAFRQDSSLGGGGNVSLKDDFTFEMNVAMGHVLIRAPITRPEWRLSRVTVKGLDITDAGVDVPPNTNLDDVVVEITNDRSEVSGHVVDESGKVVRDCWVIMFSQDRAHWAFQSPSLSTIRPGQDPEDFFRLRAMPGHYYVVAITEVEPGEWNDPEFLARIKDRAVPVSVAHDERQSIDLRLSPAPER